LTKNDTQIVFIDTPGIMKTPKDNLQAVIKQNAYNGMNGADLGIFVIDADGGFTDGIKALADTIKNKIPNLICVINKTDALKDQNHKYELAQAAFDSGLFEEIFGISARKGHNIDLVIDYIVAKANEGQWHYDPEDITDRPNVFIASEITRGVVFEKAKEEVPYCVNVVTPVFKFHEGFIHIVQDIVCIRESQKGILIGEHGSMVKTIRLESQKRLEDFYQQKVELELTIKVKDEWIDKLKEE
jgi:GTP-binding protein Era